MVYVLISDENFKKFVFSALELLGFDYAASPPPSYSADDTVIFTEAELDEVSSLLPDCEARFLLLSRKRSARKIRDSLARNSADVRFLCCPFELGSLTEMIARDGRAEKSARTEEPVEYSPESCTVSRGGGSVRLTEREGILFAYLFSRRGECVRREEIASAVWGKSENSTNVVDVYVNYLRKKLNPLLGESALKTVRGVGYMLDCGF